MEEDTEMAKLRMKDVFTREAYRCLTAQERRLQLKVEQASECSGWRNYPTTCHKLRERIPEDWWTQYPAEHIGAVMALLKVAYDDGKEGGECES